MSFPKWGPGDTGLPEPNQFIQIPASDLPPSVVTTVSPPTGVAVTDTANIQNAINAAPTGGRVLLQTGTYKLNDALVIPGDLTLEGVSAAPIFQSITSGGNSERPNTAPYFSGTVLQQTVAGKDIVSITASAITPHLKRLGLVFQAGLANTGHGVKASPSQAYGPGHDMGVNAFHWEEVYVYGQDGNHYGFYLLNPQLGTLTHCHSYGGGGFYIASDVGSINAGNLVLVHPYACLFNDGTADGFRLSAGADTTPGLLNLIAMIRPQAIMDGATTQTTYNDQAGSGQARNVALFAANFEGTTGSNPPKVGANTEFVGAPYVTTAGRWNGATGSFTAGTGAGGKLGYNAQYDTLIGPGAGAACTTGQHNTGVGYAALSAVTTTDGGTAIGSGALQYNAGEANTAIGHGALQGPSGGATGAENCAMGLQALQSLDTGVQNVAIGYVALLSVTSGSNNTVVGRAAGYFTNGSVANAIVTGAANTFVGVHSGSYSGDISNATTIGYQALAVSNALAVGYSAQARGNGSVAIGVDHTSTGAVATTQDYFVLGTANHKLFIPGLPSADPHVAGQLWTNAGAVTVSAG